jgi:hypothetical protein
VKHRRAAFVFHPGRVFIAFAGRANYGGVNKRSFAHASTLGFEIESDDLKEAAVEPMRQARA